MLTTAWERLALGRRALVNAETKGANRTCMGVPSGPQQLEARRTLQRLPWLTLGTISTTASHQTTREDEALPAMPLRPVPAGHRLGRGASSGQASWLGMSLDDLSNVSFLSVCTKPARANLG